MAKVTVIPATRKMMTSEPIISKRKRRVAGYARVSTDREEQKTSYETQKSYYTDYIGSRDDWEFVGMYADEGKTATNTKFRDGFNKMITDALAGKIDLIITKSVSRFARNTVDSLNTVRKLKDKGIEVYFEKENIWTLDAKGELLITIMSSLAQEESRSISENTTWGKRKSFAKGNVSVSFGGFLGYDKGFKINEEEAETVRLIYRLFLSGDSISEIVRKLEKLKRKTATGSTKWFQSTVQRILTNEKYKGDALLQKSYTTNFLTKKRQANNGEVAQYYLEDHHEAIISPEEFAEVQVELQKRKNIGRRSSNIFSGRIICGECGTPYGAKVWHSTDKYRRVVWRCNHKYETRGVKCHTPHLTETEIKEIFIKAINILMIDKEEIISNMEMLLEAGPDASELKSEKRRLESEISELTQKLQVTDKADPEGNYNELISEYVNKTKRSDDMGRSIIEAEAMSEKIRNFIKGLRQMKGLIDEFDEELWGIMMDTITIRAKDDIEVKFRGGMSVKVSV